MGDDGGLPKSCRPAQTSLSALTGLCIDAGGHELQRVMKVDYQSPVGLHSMEKRSDRLCMSKQALMTSSR